MSIAPDEEFCVSCGDPVKQQAERCPNCGVNRTKTFNRSNRQNVFCTSCGEEIVSEAELCPNCGVRQTPATTTATASGNSDSSQLLYYGQIVLGGILFLAAFGALTDPETNIFSGLLSALILGILGCLSIPQIRSELKDNESDSSELRYYGQIALGGVLILAAFGALTDPEMNILSSLLSGLILGILGMISIPQIRSNLEKKHSVDSFGWVQSVNTVAISESHNTCTNCQGTISKGIAREYGKEFVIAGIKIYSTTEGRNHYCGSCSDVEKTLEETRSLSPSFDKSS